MDFSTLAKQRYTARGLTGAQIPKDDLNQTLLAGRIAPTACNKQLQRITTVQSEEDILKIKKAYQTFGSKCVFIVCRDRRDELMRPPDQECSGDLDMGTVCDHLMLAARELSIGSVMVNLFDPAIISSELHLPEYIEPTALLLMEYPEEDFLSPERHITQHKEISETVMYEKYID